MISFDYLDKDPCSKTQFQCQDDSCIPVGYFCNGLTNCPNQEDESACQSNNNNNNNISCLKDIANCPKLCPAHCQCSGYIFKCNSPENVTNEVRVLDLSSNVFNLESLEKFGLLVHLNLSRCRITDIRSVGERLNSHSLQNLDLSYNNIDKLQMETTFAGMPNLLYLNISNNPIAFFEMDFLLLTPKLRHLIGINTKFTTIIAMAVYNIRLYASLELLDLQNNNIENVMPKEALHSLTSVSKIVLRNNNIRNTDFYFSTSMKMLYDLDLSFNSIQNISVYMFDGLDGLRNLNLQNNQISI